MTNGTAKKPLQGLGYILLQPTFTDGKCDIWMVFCDVSKMIGDAGVDV